MKTYKTSKRFIIIVVALITGTVLYTQIFYSTMRQRVLGMLSEISFQSTHVLQKELEKEQAVLKNIAKYLSGEELDIKETLLKLNTLNDNNLFKRMGIIDKNGIAQTTDGLTMDFSDRDYFHQGMKGEDTLSAAIYDKADGEEINVFSSPIIKNEEVIAILFATYSTDYYRNLISTTIFDGQGYTYVVDSNGDCVISSNNPNSTPIENIYQTLSQNDKNIKAIGQLQNAIDKNEIGNLTYQYGQSKYMDYRPLEWNDWYVLTILPEQVIDENTNTLMFLSVTFALVCVTSISYLISYIYRTQVKNKKIQEEIIFVDALTKGNSLVKFKLEANRLLQNKQETYAIVAMDVEKFKYINDIFGHQEGDVVLRHISEALESVLNRNEICARQSGDHFILLMNGDNRPNLVSRLEKLRQQLLHCHVFEHQEYEIRTKFGVCLFEDEYNLEVVIDHADLALNLIKKEVFQSISFYDDELKQRLLNIRLVENKFELAIANKEFIVYYQPKYNIQTECYDGAEALVRWQDSEGKFITPNHFIPIFENNGSIIKLDYYVFNEVCATIRKWLDSSLSVKPISINVSRLDLYSPAFVENYLAIIKQYQIPPELIQLEITETALFDNNEDMLTIINEFHHHGIKILMDDFGTGYSSISMIKDIPIDILKIDKSLIDDSLTNDRGQTIIKMVIDLCHQFDLEITAEGVETKEQFSLLKELNCDYIQGYYCAKPMVEKDYIEIMKETSK